MASLTTIHVGDIVEVDVRGRRAFALVQDKLKKDRTLPARLAIKPITNGFNYREVTARQIVQHFRRTKNVRQVAVKSNGKSTGHNADD